MKTRVVLASQSPRRRELLAALGVEFVVHPSGIDEVTSSEAGPAGLSMENARLKAEDLSRRFPADWIIGSDTVVALNDRIFGKPDTLASAEAMLWTLQGKIHRVFSGVSLIHGEGGVVETWHEETQVGFRELSRTQIRAYLAGINPLDKAGAYAIQEGGERIVSSVVGSLSNVVGLPLESLEQALIRHGLLAKKSGPSEEEPPRT